MTEKLEEGYVSRVRQVGISSLLLMATIVIFSAIIAIPFLISATPLASNKEIMAWYGLAVSGGGIISVFVWSGIVWQGIEARFGVLLSRLAAFFEKPPKRTPENDLSPEEAIKQIRAQKKKWDLRDVDSWPDEKVARFWAEFKSTEEINVPNKLMDWVIFQDEVIRKIRIFLLDFIDTMKHIKSEVKSGKNISDVVSKRPAPKVLMVGEPGTGKTVIGKATRETLDDIYKQEGATDILDDVLCVRIKHFTNRPEIYICPAGTAKPYLRQREKLLKRRDRSFIMPVKMIFGFVATLGVVLTLFFISRMVIDISSNPIDNLFGIMSSYTLSMNLSMSMTLSASFAYYIFRSLIGGALFSSVSRDEIAELPNLLVDNSKKRVPFVDVTGATTANLFGEVEWNPVGALGAPPHKRMKAGAVHIAHGGILYNDEIKNLQQEDAVTLLSVMQNGELSIESRGTRISSGGGLDAKSGPIRAVFFMLAAGNMDISSDPNSIINRLTAFKDRFDSHGAIIPMNNSVPITMRNKAKVAQFVAQEVFRLGLLPMDNSGVQRIISYLIRLSGKNEISTRLRLGMGQVKKAGLLAREEKAKIITAEHVDKAEEMFAPSQQKAVKDQVEERRQGKIILSKGGEVGRVNGLVAIKDPITGAMVGDVVVVTAFMKKVTEIKHADFLVTGIKEANPEWIADSIKTVRTTILRRYHVDIARECYTHISFVQSNGIDGPSAGITMALAIASILGDPTEFRKTREFNPIRIRQDTAITGAIENVEEEGKILVSRVGAIPEKCQGAQENGLKLVIMPKINLGMLSEEEKERLKIELDCAGSFEEFLEKMEYKGE
ncbi:MAG: AAA family ATPase [Candidatus Nealsonbacteria bacterium]|nr:AAA family ATPase [Candidatus Nealsonbacteria bacterium]